MKKIFSFWLLILPFLLQAQTFKKDSSVTVLPKWKKGDEKIFLISREKQSNEDGDEEPFQFQYEAHVTVLDSTADGYFIRWVFQLPAEIVKSVPQIAEAMPVYNGMKMLFTTHEDGSFKELTNWEEVRNVYVKMMLLSMPKPSPDSAVFNKVLAMFSTREMTENTLIKEIQLYHSPYGGEFTTKGITGTSFQPNPMGGDPIPATVLQKNTGTEAGNDDNIRIILNQEVDKAAAAAMIEKLFKKADIVPDSAMNSAKEALNTLEVSDKNEYVFSKSTGWLRKVKYQRVGSAMEIKQTETIIIEMK